jgi:hypothetical protein
MMKVFVLAGAALALIGSASASVDEWLTPRFENWRDAVEFNIKDYLRDPESARFRDLTSNRLGVVCGYVNARGEHGGYVGWQPFHGRLKTTVTTIEYEFIPDVTEFDHEFHLEALGREKGIEAFCINAGASLPNLPEPLM